MNNTAFMLGFLKVAKYDGRKGPDFKTLQKNKVPLTPEERAKVMKSGAVWNFHFGPVETINVTPGNVRAKEFYKKMGMPVTGPPTKIRKRA